MPSKRIAFWLLFAVTAAVYGTMVLWSLPRISAAAGGLAPFDLRPRGYSVTEAQAFLAALKDDGRHFYAAVQHRLDWLYPALLAATLYSAIAALLPGPRGTWRWFVAAPVIAVMLFDYAENAAVAALLAADPAAIDAAAVERASTWTVLKSNTTAAATIVLLALSGWRGVARLRARAGRP